MTNPTALIVPMAGVDPVVRPIRQALHGSGDAGMPAHVTLMYPFVPLTEVDETVRAQLRGLFARFSPFRATFRRAVRMDGLLYLEPEPGEAFMALYEGVRAAWPSLLPYEGKYGTDYTPHLSIAYGEDGRIDPNGFFGPMEQALAPHLPLQAEAEAAWLVVRRDDHWVHQGSFFFSSGGDASSSSSGW